MLYVQYWTVRPMVAAAPRLVRDYTESLSRGQTGLLQTPDPRLLALPNPYDRQANQGVRMLDASLYHGRYFLYFGLTPFLTLLVPVYRLTGQHLPAAWAIAFFCGAGFLVYAVLIEKLRQRFFPSARLAALGGMLLIGLASGLLCLLRGPDIHELELASAYCCTAIMLAAV